MFCLTAELSGVAVLSESADSESVATGADAVTNLD